MYIIILKKYNLYTSQMFKTEVCRYSLFHQSETILTWFFSWDNGLALFWIKLTLIFHCWLWAVLDYLLLFYWRFTSTLCSSFYLFRNNLIRYKIMLWSFLLFLHLLFRPCGSKKTTDLRCFLKLWIIRNNYIIILLQKLIVIFLYSMFHAYPLLPVSYALI